MNTNVKKAAQRQSYRLFQAFKRRERCTASVFWNNQEQYSGLVHAYHRAWMIHQDMRGYGPLFGAV